MEIFEKKFSLTHKKASLKEALFITSHLIEIPQGVLPKNQGNHLQLAGTAVVLLRCLRFAQR